MEVCLGVPSGVEGVELRLYQGCTNSSWCSLYIYICMEVHVPY